MRAKVVMGRPTPFLAKPRSRRRVSASRKRLRRLINFLPEKEVIALVQEAEKKLSPLMKALMEAPIDDEPTTEEDLRDMEEAEEAIKQGLVTPWEDVKRELGL